MFKGIGKRLLLASVGLAAFGGLVFGVYIILIYQPGQSSLVTILHVVFMVLIVSLAAAGTAFIAGRTVAAPLEELTALAGRISPGETGLKAVPSGEDETGELGHAFNKMVERFNSSHIRLSSERDRMGLILSRMGDGILVLDGKGAITSINPAAERIFNLEPGKACGLSFIEAVRDYELERPVRRCLKSKQPQQEYLDLKDKGLYLGLVVTPLVSEPGCLVVLQDLSRLKKLETVRRDFVANLSHELRTPVASVKLLAETLNEGAIDDRQVSADFLSRIAGEAGKMAEIVEGMTTLSRIESGDVRLNKKPVEIPKLIHQAFERLKSQMEVKRLEYETDMQQADLTAMADAIQLEQVVYNILHNAVKFTPEDGRVKVSAFKEGPNLTVCIEDTGPGIAPDELERIFERFYKADKSRAGTGTGLGLAIARHIVEFHGGRIWAHSIPGRGSRICFSLPL
ncbi:MAG: HAMP domain-containing protein [Dehalococcoidaceae bacterium]|nr:HAMP domain-containing protein [Dehalococcoidaceae bacterium]